MGIWEASHFQQNQYMEQIQVMAHCLHHWGELEAPPWAMLPQDTLLHFYVQGEVGEQLVEAAMEEVPVQEVEIVWQAEERLTTSLIPAHLLLATLESFAQVCILLLLHGPLSHLLEQDPTNTYLPFSLLLSYPLHKATQIPEDLDHNRTIHLHLLKPSRIQACLV